MQYLVKHGIYCLDTNNNNFNNFIEKVTPIITPNDLEVIKGFIKNISRSNLIKIIGIIRTNKYNFQANKEINLYNKIIDELYKELNYKFNKIDKKIEEPNDKVIPQSGSIVNGNPKDFEPDNKTEKVEKEEQVKKVAKLIINNPKDFDTCYNEIFESINNLEDILKPENNKYIENMYGLKIFVQIEKNKNDNTINPYYSLESEPVLDVIDEDKRTFIIYYVKFLLKITENLKGKENKVICVLTMFDFLFRHYNFIISNNKFAQTVYSKINEIIKSDLNVLVDTCLKYYNKPNIVFTWRDNLKNLIETNT